MQANQWEIARILSPVDGKLIRYGTLNRHQRTKHAIVFSNGRTEWVEKYTDFFKDLELPDDHMVVCLDHRGQGDSEGSRAHVDNYAHFAEDLRAVIAATCENITYDLLCHSMGSLIGIYATLCQSITPRKIVLSGPLFGLPNIPVPRILARPVSSTISAVGFRELSTGAANHDKTLFENNLLTTDKGKWNIILNNPYPVPAPTFGWVSATFKATDLIFEDNLLGKLPCSVLVLVGEKESVVDKNAITRWVRIASKRSKFKIQFEEIRGGKHELFFEGHEPYQQVLKHTRNFLKSPSKDKVEKVEKGRNTVNHEN